MLEQDGSKEKSSGSSGLALVLAGGLLVLICGALAVLWISERRARIRAEGQVIQLRQTLESILVPADVKKRRSRLPASPATTQPGS